MKYLYLIVNEQLSRIKFLIRAKAPLWLIIKAVFLNLRNLRSPKRKEYVQIAEEFRNKMVNRQFDQDWFSRQIPTWLAAFEQNNISKDSELSCLEIGSWQGLSAYFTLSHFDKAKLVCVDTWEGSDENTAEDFKNSQFLGTLEQVFDRNLEEYSDRLEKFKGLSIQYFAERFEPNKFDFIYVDGSHHSDDVMVDAVKSFEMLKTGGLMVFDDYFWNYYDAGIDNPAGAIHSFLRLKKRQISLVCVDYQIVIEKTANSPRMGTF